MAATSGTLTSKVSSTASSPTVNYSGTYTATRTNATVSVRLIFTAWLNSEKSTLGTGIKLTVFARINGGAWQSAVIKSGSASWSGTAKHTAVLTLSADTADSTAKIEFYVSRTGSSYSGSAGVLGGVSSPKGYRVTLPAYTAEKTTESGSTDTSPAGNGYVYLCVGGVWKKAVPYVKSGGVWKKAAPYVRVNGAWKSTE